VSVTGEGAAGVRGISRELFGIIEGAHRFDMKENTNRLLFWQMFLRMK